MDKRQLKLIFTVSSVGLLLPFLAFAAPCPINDSWIKCLINNIVNMVVWPVFAFVVIVLFLFAGLRFLTARGDATKVDSAKKAAMWGVIGIAFAIMAFSIIASARWLLGV